MTVEEYNALCRALPHTTHVVQWGGAHVWKVAGKVFAIGTMPENTHKRPGELHVTFKCSDMSFEMLSEVPGCRPAPYLASRGMKWIQRFESSQSRPGEMDDDGLAAYIRESHRIVASGLPKRVQAELGLGAAAGMTPAVTRARRAAGRTVKSTQAKSTSTRTKPRRRTSQGDRP